MSSRTPSAEEFALSQLVDALVIMDETTRPFTTCTTEFGRIEFKVECAAGGRIVALNVTFMRDNAQLLEVPLGRLTSLTSLRLPRLPPQLLPSTIGLLTALETLDLPDSGVGGLLPSELARLTRLKTCFLGAHNVLSRTLIACPLPPLPAACAFTSDELEGPDAPRVPLRCNPLAAPGVASIAIPPATRSLPAWWTATRSGEWSGVISFRDGISRLESPNDIGRFVCSDSIYHLQATLKMAEGMAKISIGAVVAGSPSFAGRQLDPTASARLFDSPYFGQIPAANGSEILIWQRRFGSMLGAFDCALSRMPLGRGPDAPFELFFTTDLLDCLNIPPTVMCRARDAPKSQWTAIERFYDAATVTLSVHRFRYDPMGALGALEVTDAQPVAPSSDVSTTSSTIASQAADTDVGVIVGASIAAVVVLAIAVAAIIAFFVARSSRRRPASLPTSTYAQVDGDVFGSNSSIPNSNASIPMPGTEYSSAPKPTQSASAFGDNYALAPTPGKIQGSNAPMQHYKNIESYGVAPGPAPGHE